MAGLLRRSSSLVVSAISGYSGGGELRRIQADRILPLASAGQNEPLHQSTLPQNPNTPIQPQHRPPTVDRKHNTDPSSDPDPDPGLCFQASRSLEFMRAASRTSLGERMGSTWTTSSEHSGI